MTNGASSCTCDYCGTEQTIPTVNDENLQGLFNRANVLRLKSEFDKAEEIYERILQSSETESEAYWGLILCKYGVEYVEDPATLKRIPTCHRTSYDAITADEDYRNALKYADVVQRGIYESEAKAIDEIQKGILAISQKEEPYDIFICYKETDETGKRTKDSVIANDIYYQLVYEGFKVFYAAITLEDKIGSEFEPYIFSAINTAKVMITLATKPEYFNAVWVKNEWSRYLKIMKNDRAKMLIPCYKDMDAYELPEEFAHLQAQDMSKIGFINDLVRGIKKVVAKDDKTTKQTETVVVGGSANAATLLKRVFMFLEDGEWEKADKFCEQVLNIDPENSAAYIGKLMAELEVKTRSELEFCSKPFDFSNNYSKAYRFGDSDIKNELNYYIEKINDRNTENNYQSVKRMKDEAVSDKEYLKAANLFDKLMGYKDSEELAKECRELAVESKYLTALEIMNNAETEEEYKDAAGLFQKLDHYKDSDDKVLECEQGVLRIKYEAAKKNMDAADTEEAYKNAALMFAKIAEFSDADEMEKKCLILAEEIRKNIVYNNALDKLKTYNIWIIEKAEYEFMQIQDWRDSAEKIKECKSKVARIKELRRKKKRKNVIISILVCVVIVAVIAAIIVIPPAVKRNTYAAAVEAYDTGDYTEAIAMLEELEDYENSEDYLIKAKLATIKVGDVITFGTIEQDNNFENGNDPIEWTVLDVQDNRVLILSNYLLFGTDMSNDDEAPDWADCRVRIWLNNSFISNFSETESSYIVDTTNINNMGDNTVDKLFILSADELDKYLPEGDARIGKVTESAKTVLGNAHSWWLRSKDRDGDFHIVNRSGEVKSSYFFEDEGIRPAMWIRKE